ncbi:MAG: TIGR04168 family protein, partial [Cyanobacteria bacterium J06628_3]
LNAASVPRIIEKPQDKLRNFSIVELEDGKVAKASLVWIGNDFTIKSEEILYEKSTSMVQPA